jgi:hypothetical protein
VGRRISTNESTRNSTVADVARKVMGDAPIAYVEGAGGTRVAEDQIVAPGKNDVGMFPPYDCNTNAKPNRYYPSKLADNTDFDTNSPSIFTTPQRPSMQPVPLTVDEVLLTVPFLLVRHSCCGHELADLWHKVVHFERCDMYPMTGISASEWCPFAFLLNYPSSF